ncbi:E3 ubiquitin ligase PQT3-like isoform X2 [Asparagus officinalis]|uniref:E3 ubiquitin ligase PQT3-like isoform X2 n=1 Tax=Asparagus officinalis TaxID=4686 RepID=UPI00098E4743|nr:E3 ubiquitin ligase PQT3-like isoform X2 [Asparagus officinalis]
MSIRFKFRSSLAFESVDLDGRRSISVGELRAKIIARKKLQLCKDFDLIISDAETGAAFENEEIELREGSSVVVKRVPAELSSPCDLNVGNVARKDRVYAERVATVHAQNVDKENFDDFCVDLFPVHQGSLPECNDAIGNMNFTANKKDKLVTRFSEAPVQRCQNVERPYVNKAMSKEGTGDNCFEEPANEEIQKQIKLGLEKEEPQKFDKHAGMPLPMAFDMDLPMELRCSLCNAIFKDAVMIPCCQHSFCGKCIQMALLESGRCPKCSSMKCTVGTLLPNLTLRQAIDHFLEAEAANNALENKFPRDVPDVESGIHAKEVSFAMSIRKKEQGLPHSPSGTGRESNPVMAKSAYEITVTGGIGKSTPLQLNMINMKGNENSSEAACNLMAGFHGVPSSSKLPQNFLQDEVNLACQKNKVLGVTIVDGGGPFMPSNRNRKGDRNCFMCGSPDHLIRDCPAASNSYPFNQTDPAFAGGIPMYGQAYWHGNTFLRTRPYANTYGSQEMMPFDPTRAQLSPGGVSPFMSSMYTGMAGPYGFMRTGGGQPTMMPEAERPLNRQTFLEPLHAHQGREPGLDRMPEDCYYKGLQTTLHKRKEHAGSFLDEESPKVHKQHQDNRHYGSSHRQPDEEHSVERKHERHQSISWRDLRARHPEKSNSDSSNRHSRDRKRNHHAISLEKQSERRGHCTTAGNKKVSEDEKVDAGHKKHSHRHHNLSASREQKQYHREIEASHNSRPSKQIPKLKVGHKDYERRELIEGLDDKYRGGYYHKRQRGR